MTRFVLVIGLVLAAGPAEAQEGKKDREKGKRGERQGPTAEQILKKADKDADGRISKDEFLREAYEKFRGGEGRKPGAKKLDKDQDGEVSFEEFAAAPYPNDRFKKADRDGSGFLERPELDALATDLGREQRKGSPEFVKRFDDDGDGKVSRQEFTGPDAAFERMDRNRDGFVGAGDEPDGAPPPAPPAPPGEPGEKRSGGEPQEF